MSIIHEIKPIYAPTSRILILGTFPSVKSREGGFFYHHPQNRFWKVLAALTKQPLPTTISEKKSFLLKTGIAVWDVIASCDITGSSDNSIKNVVPNDFAPLLHDSSILQIFTNGGTAHKLYEKYCQKEIGRTAIKLPSTSPANASYSLERLITEWSTITEFLNIRDCSQSPQFAFLPGKAGNCAEDMPDSPEYPHL